MKPLRATQMPKIRDELLRWALGELSVQHAHVSHAAAGIKAERLASHAPLLGLLRQPDQLELWWLHEDAVTLAIAATHDLRGLRDLQQTDHPAGILWLDGGVHFPVWGDVHLRVDAVSWFPFSTGKITTRLVFWQRTDRGLARITAGGIAALGPAAYGSPTVAATEHIWSEIGYALSYLVAAAMLLADEPTVTEARPATWAQDGHPRETRTREIPSVTVLNVRSRPATEGPHGERLTDREFDHRWIVRGHMHTVAYGPGRSLRRKQWRAPYVAGPADKPLVRKDRVWTLRGSVPESQAA